MTAVDPACGREELHRLLARPLTAVKQNCWVARNGSGRRGANSRSEHSHPSARLVRELPVFSSPQFSFRKILGKPPRLP